MGSPSFSLTNLRNPFFAQRPQDAFFNLADPTAVAASPDSTANANAQPAATASAAEQPPKVQPGAATPDATTAPGGSAMVAPGAAPTGPMSRDSFFEQNPDATKAFVPPRPIGELDNVHGLRRGLALGFGGLANFGAGLLHREDPTLNRWTQQELAERQYDANLPHLQAEAQNQAYQRYLGEQQESGGIARTAAETTNLQQNSPAIQRKAQFLAQLQGEAESGKYDPAALRARALRMARAGNVIVDPSEIDDTIQNTKPLGSKYQVQQDKNGRPELITDRQGNRMFPDANGKFADPEAQAQWDAISQAHGKSIQEETTKEERVAGFAADRQAAGFENAANVQNRQHTFELENKRRGEVLKEDLDLNDSSQRYQQLNTAVDAAQRGNTIEAQNAVLKTLGLSLDGITKRINTTELAKFEDAGSAGQRLAGHLRGWTEGNPFPDSIWKDVKEFANDQYQAAQQKHDKNVQVINTSYGHQEPAAPAQGGPGGGPAQGIQVKAPDGSVHTFPNQGAADNFKKLAHIP